eukprot:jgi/Chlat1/2538/Chrsp175S02391
MSSGPWTTFFNALGRQPEEHTREYSSSSAGSGQRLRTHASEKSRHDEENGDTEAERLAKLMGGAALTGSASKSNGHHHHGAFVPPHDIEETVKEWVSRSKKKRSRNFKVEDADMPKDEETASDASDDEECLVQAYRSYHDLGFRGYRFGLNLRNVPSFNQTHKPSAAHLGQSARHTPAGYAEQDLSVIDEQHGAASLPPQRALYAAAMAGDVPELKRLLQLPYVNINAVDDGEMEKNSQGQSALMAAVRWGQLEAIDVLLHAGADPVIKDAAQRDIWWGKRYYAFFSIQMPTDAHIKVVQVLLDHCLEPDARVLLMAAYASDVTILPELLGSLERRVTSRDSAGYCTFEFGGLHMLDSCHHPVVWPDGACTPAGETALQAMVVKDRLQALVQPSVLALLQWKWQQFGRMCFWAEFALFIFLVVSSSAMAQEMSNIAARTTTNDAGEQASAVATPALRAFTGCTLFFALFFTMVQVFDFLFETRRGMVPDRVTHAISLSTYGAMLAGCLAVHAGAPPDSDVLRAVVAFALLSVWFRLVHYLELFRGIGPFFIMVQEFVRQDMVKFIVIFLVLYPGFPFAFMLITSSSDPETNEFRPAQRSAFYLLQLMFGLVSWPSSAHSAPGVILLMLFLVLLPILCINLFIALINFTYSRIQQMAIEEWAGKYARFLLKRQLCAVRIKSQYTEDLGMFVFNGRFDDYFLTRQVSYKDGIDQTRAFWESLEAHLEASEKHQRQQAMIIIRLLADNKRNADANARCVTSASKTHVLKLERKLEEQSKELADIKQLLLQLHKHSST